MKNRQVPIVVGIGELLWDMLPEGRRLGGAPANFAYHAAAQGAEAYVVSAVGDDPDGKDILAELGQKSLDSRYVSVAPEHPTGTVSVELTNGIPSYAIREPVAWDYIPFSQKLARLAKSADAVCFGTLAQRHEESAATIRTFIDHTRPDCLNVFDANLRGKFFSAELINASLRRCHILKISDEELSVVAELSGIGGDMEGIIRSVFARYRLRYLILTKGKTGSLAYDGKNISEVPIFEFGPVADTVGCGDSFTAVLTVGLLRGITIAEAMNMAAQTAGYVASCHGAMPEMPCELYSRPFRSVGMNKHG